MSIKDILKFLYVTKWKFDYTSWILKKNIERDNKNEKN